MVVWSGDDAAATASDGHLCAFEDQISEPPQVAEFAQSLRVETGQYRDDENFQIRAALASRRGADDVPSPWTVTQSTPRSAALATVMRNRPSVDFCGYWQCSRVS
jgi:hypothetical protein